MPRASPFLHASLLLDVSRSIAVLQNIARGNSTHLLPPRPRLAKLDRTQQYCTMFSTSTSMGKTTQLAGPPCEGRQSCRRMPASATPRVSPLHSHGFPAAKPSSLSRRPRHLALNAEAAADSEATVTTAADYFATDSRPVVLFDGVCNMCNGGVTFCLDWDKKGVVRFAALQSEVGRALLQRCGRAPDDISSIVLVEDDTCYIKSEAVLRIGQKLEMPLPILTTLAFPLPLFFRDEVYDFIAANRYIVFGRTESCRLSDDRFADRFVN